ncbi:hypothetical protein ACRS7F_13510 [Brucella anthropi]|uniref:hypothetical protein n=1 Tax=Brucella anthropi TaxID=529 RepID=UPI003EE1CB30
MAQRDYSVRFGAQQILIGPKYTPGEITPPSGAIFSSPCGITGLTRQITTNTNDVALPPCNAPDDPIWLGIDIVSKRMQSTFTGTLADEALPLWDAWSQGSDLYWCRWYRNLGAPNAGYWEGPAALTEYQEESTDRGRYTNSGTIIWDGQPEWHAIPPAPSITTAVAIPTTAPEVGTAFVATPGTYTGTPALAYQWFADGIAISAATTASYTPVAGDVGKVLHVVETATNVSGSINSQSASSLPVVTA